MPLAGSRLADQENGHGRAGREPDLFQESADAPGRCRSGIRCRRTRCNCSRNCESRVRSFWVCESVTLGGASGSRTWPSSPSSGPRDRETARTRCVARPVRNRHERSASSCRRDGRRSPREEGRGLRQDRSRSAATGRIAGNAIQPQDRFGRADRSALPGSVHPGHAERRIEPEHRLSRLLPELVRLEGRNAWRRHEKWFSLGFRD